MIAQEIITNDILPLRPDDNCGQAMSMMSIYRVNNLPVVENSELLGMVTEDIVSSVDINKTIGTFSLSHTFIYVTVDEHVFDILAKMSQNNLTVIPVLNKDNKYVGLISQEHLTRYIANAFSFNEPGSIIVIETTKSEYSLSEITRVLESEGAVVLASFVSSMLDNPNLLITIKVHRQEISKLITSLERYDYTIHATFSEDDFESDLKTRYDLLMTYLNV